jgi:hypothetical protein
MVRPVRPVFSAKLSNARRDGCADPPCVLHPEMEEARRRSNLRTNAFVQLRRMFVDGESVLAIKDLSDSEALFHNDPSKTNGVDADHSRRGRVGRLAGPI